MVLSCKGREPSGEQERERECVLLVGMHWGWEDYQRKSNGGTSGQESVVESSILASMAGVQDARSKTERQFRVHLEVAWSICTADKGESRIFLLIIVTQSRQSSNSKLKPPAR